MGAPDYLASSYYEHSAKIVNAVHGDALLCCDQGGGPAIAVPIIASRVTQAASRSALAARDGDAVPRGRYHQPG
jgi:hypothetical protein